MLIYVASGIRLSTKSLIITWLIFLSLLYGLNCINSEFNLFHIWVDVMILFMILISIASVRHRKWDKILSDNSISWTKLRLKEIKNKRNFIFLDNFGKEIWSKISIEDLSSYDDYLGARLNELLDTGKAIYIDVKKEKDGIYIVDYREFLNEIEYIVYGKKQEYLETLDNIRLLDYSSYYSLIKSICFYLIILIVWWINIVKEFYKSYGFGFNIGNSILNIFISMALIFLIKVLIRYFKIRKFNNLLKDRTKLSSYEFVTIRINTVSTRLRKVRYRRRGRTRTYHRRIIHLNINVDGIEYITFLLGIKLSENQIHRYNTSHLKQEVKGYKIGKFIYIIGEDLRKVFQ